MPKPVSVRKSLLACLADCVAAVPFGRNLRTITLASSHSFYTRCEPLKTMLNKRSYNDLKTIIDEKL